MPNKIGVSRTWFFCLLLACLAARVSAGGLDVAQAIARSDIAIGQPNVLSSQAMGLGNGRLGAAFWAADGLTLQLNRIDTLPDRRSPGQVSLPDLKALTADRGFHGRVDLYDGALEESGDGIALRAWVDRDADRVVIDLAGLPAQGLQHVRLHLWEPRAPIAGAGDGVAWLAETWRDEGRPGASGRRFGSLAAIQATGAQARVLDARTVELAAHAGQDGRLRVVIAAPAFDGARTAADVARDALAPAIDPARTADWWHAYWTRAYRIQAQSDDGVARYAETLRTLYLFAAAAHGGGDIPGSQAGIADLYAASRDDHFWDPAAYWFWNTRMQVGAHLAAGLPELNAPVFALYRNRLDAIRQWTRDRAGGRPGICVPETMRFNGKGVEYESERFRPFAIVTHSCDLAWSQSSNARTLSTGAEIGLWVWRTYLQTDDRAFLEANYPLMAEAARFLLAYQRPGQDGLLHTAPSNAHETQMDVTDPATDIAAIRTLYPATIAAAKMLGRDDALATQLRQALARTPTLPLMPDPHDAGAQVLAASHDADAPYRNGENIGLEAVWPYALISADDALFPVARRTFASRPFVHAATWSYDPVQAARLGLGKEAAQAIFQLVQLYQVYPNGMAALLHDLPNEFYLEQAAITALALSDMLAIQDADGLVRIGPAIPPGWRMAGTVALRHGASVEVEAVDGHATAFTLHDAGNATINFATPWQGHQVQLWQDGKPDRQLDGGRFAFHATAGHVYRFALAGETASPAFAAQPKATVKTLGRAAIGLGPPCCAPPAGYDPAKDR